MADGLSPVEIGVIFLLCTAFAGLIFVFVQVDRYRVRRKLQPIADALGLKFREDNRDGATSALVGTWSQVPVEIGYTTSSRSRPARFSMALRIPRPSGPEVEFRREGEAPRLAKAIGLTREAEAGDPTFDQQVFVESEDDEKAAAVIAQSGVRSSVLALLAVPRAKVTLDLLGASVTIENHRGWKRCFQPAAVEETLSHLLDLSHSSASTREAPIFTPAMMGRSRAVTVAPAGRAVILVAALLAFGGPALALWGSRYPTVTWRLPLLGLALGGGSLLIYVPILFRSVRGSSRSHRQFGRFLFLAVVGFPSFFVGALTTANGLLDSGSPRLVESHVVGRVAKGSRLQVWVDLGERSGIASMRVGASRYQTARRGQEFPLVIFPGALGEPWIAGAAVN